MIAARIPEWTPHPDVWLLVGALAASYAIAVLRVGPRFAAPGSAPVTRSQVACFALGVAAVWVAADWPVHDVAERSMYSVHMVQHLLLAMVAVPLLLLGTPGWLARWLLRPPSVAFRVLRRISRFLPALIVFNVVLVLTHWPALVNESLRSGVMHFAIHALIVVSSIVFPSAVL